jgi:hypothetical protein
VRELKGMREERMELDVGWHRQADAAKEHLHHGPLLLRGYVLPCVTVL